MRHVIQSFLFFSFLIGIPAVYSQEPDDLVSQENRSFSEDLVKNTLVADNGDLFHKPFDDVLREHVNDGHVDYTGIKSDQRFYQYLESLVRTNPDRMKSDKERLAFWINAYNALAIKGILDGLSPGSFISRITYFTTTDYEVAGREINLYDLERDVIIPFAEPRIHFAIVCASFSCPKLRSEAYVASRLDEQLDENTRDFINDKTKNKFDVSKKRASLSKIFDWFEKDFKQHSGSVQKYVANFVDDKAVAGQLVAEKFKVKYLKYNWSLNGTLVN